MEYIIGNWFEQSEHKQKHAYMCVCVCLRACVRANMYILNLHACVQKKRLPEGSEGNPPPMVSGRRWSTVWHERHHESHAKCDWNSVGHGAWVHETRYSFSASTQRKTKEKYHQQGRTTTYRNHCGLYCPLGLARGFPEICLKKQEWSKNWPNTKAARKKTPNQGRSWNKVSNARGHLGAQFQVKVAVKPSNHSCTGYIPTYGSCTVPWFYNPDSGPRSRNPVQGRICIIKALQGNLASLLGLGIPPPCTGRKKWNSWDVGTSLKNIENTMIENECIITIFTVFIIMYFMRATQANSD